MRDCSHPIILFFDEDLTFRCMKCNEKLIKLASKNEFNLFCTMSATDPKSLVP